ncbi:MAG: DUF429 domain-containing protein [Halioglobus sp.]
MTKAISIIGVDCSTNPKKLGLARGIYSDGKCMVIESTIGVEDPVGHIVAWIKSAERCLIAIDAPLGWPQPMGQMLAGHQAGDPLREDSNKLFRRYTDRFIKQSLNKQPLDVGSNLIARTAHFAVNFLESVRERSGETIPMAWHPVFDACCAAIEVYPAATLEARRISSLGYKKPEQRDVRRRLIEILSDELIIEGDADKVVATDDTFEAAICLLAAADFLNNKCYLPSNDKLDLVKKESWIWVKQQ